MTRRTRAAGRTVLIAHPSSDVYGADLQLLESVSGLVQEGWRVVVVIPAEGPLDERLRARGAQLRVVDFPVLRRSYADPRGLASLIAALLRAMPRLMRVIRQVSPSAIVVNTTTLPWWLLMARIKRIPVACHVHEAETTDPWVVRFALTAPLLLATAVIVNSKTSAAAAQQDVPLLKSRIRLIYNGVPAPPEPLAPAPDRHFGVVVVGRLSPRKAQDVALEAMALVRAAGVDAQLEICGTTFEGYEWYEAQLVARSLQEPLAGHVTWSGYVSPIWPALQRAHLVLAPSLREPFGNAVVEAQLAGRPVIAAAALGHLETVQDGRTGLLVPPGDAAALAEAVLRLHADPQLADRLAAQGRSSAGSRFSVERYRSEFAQLMTEIAGKAADRAEREVPHA